MVIQLALEGELDDHLGCGRHDPAGRDGGNSRNGHRAKTVITEAGPAEISVPRWPLAPAGRTTHGRPADRAMSEAWQLAAMADPQPKAVIIRRAWPHGRVVRVGNLTCAPQATAPDCS
jgi:hypothetical protein